MQGKALPGFRDFYPDDLALRSHIFTVWKTVAHRYGFEEYDGPPLEPLELYTRKSGEEIVQQLYAFTDKGDREVALRPEMTPTLARMVGARAQALKKPIRWFSIPQLFRYERQQRGRLREHFQLNMDLIGEGGPLADAELIAAALDIMRAFGLGPKDVKVRVSDRRVLRALFAGRGIGEAQLPEAFQALDKSERDPKEAIADRLQKAGLAAKAVDGVFDVAGLKGLPRVEQALAKVAGGEEAGAPLAEVVAALGAMGLGDFVEVDLTIVRGLAYYTGAVFELFDAQRTLRAICGGGRYDDLLKQIGGVDLPCAGFGMGDVVLAELLKDRGAAPPAPAVVDVFLVAISGEDTIPVLELAHRLRDAGVSVEYALKHGAIRRQLELAAARGAKHAVIIGPDERKDGVAVVRDLAGGTERRVPLDAIRHGILSPTDGAAGDGSVAHSRT
ncbi:MAG TPA: histidine--tRNA ligase [Gemmatimonadales bacterium]|nr:histidine--tRNA ligase [Gemmatimonadales bacterium]